MTVKELQEKLNEALPDDADKPIKIRILRENENKDLIRATKADFYVDAFEIA